MIYSIYPGLKDYTIVLASSSPRRKELLEKIGLEFQVKASNFAEDLNKSNYSPIDYCQKTAYLKTLDVYDRIKVISSKQSINVKDITKPLIIIGSDTVILKDDKILEKPKDKSNALTMLTSLSGSTHQVITCLCLIVREDSEFEEIKEYQKINKTEVNFDCIDEKEITAYINTEDPLDKAGGYGIQGPASIFIKEIKGDYYGVMGFPLNTFYTMLKEVFKK
ncbi:acetylserotonin O-methyltransferase-like protein [Neoconidiobolus thromboides FSU 785]|nr:acetylserotonin O-methyltransferase-like protein [Neoconidiobolus thromboides FSU 785]